MKLQVSAWAIRNPLPVTMLFALLTLAGLFAYQKMPVSDFPNMGLPVVTVTVSHEGAAPAAVENQITRLVEDSLANNPAIDTISSIVTRGLSVTTVRFESGTDMQKAQEDVKSSVDGVRSRLPSGIEPPVVRRAEWDIALVATYAIRSSRMSMADTTHLFDKVITRKLQSEPGVYQVLRIGGRDREVNVVLDPERMAGLQVTAAEVENALAAYHTDFPGGKAIVTGTEQSVRILGETKSLAELADLEIPVGDRFVRLSDIAEVGMGEAQVRSFARLNGQPVIGFEVWKTKGSDIIEVEKDVRAAVSRLRKEYPDIEFVQVVDNSKPGRDLFTATSRVLWEGIVLAVVVLFLFLRDTRATLIAALAMPLSLIPTFIFMWYMEFSLNLVSLLALTLVIGILVDDTIVEIENIQKRMLAGERPYDAASKGADAIGMAVLATTATIVTVFLPVSYMPGSIGRYFREFGLTIAAAVTVSLLVARLMIPLLAAYFLKPPSRSIATRQAHDVKPGIPAFYASMLDRVLQHPKRYAFVGTFAFLAMSIAIAANLPVGVQSDQDLGYFYVDISGPPGATQETMEQAIDEASRIIERQPDVERVFAQAGAISGPAGSAGTEAAEDLREGAIIVVLKADRSASTTEIQAAIAPKLKAIPEARFSNQGNFSMAPVSVVLSGEDGTALEKAQAELLKQMRSLPAIADPRPTPQLPGPELDIVPRPAEAARLNVDSRTIADTVRIALIGDRNALVAKFSDGPDQVPIRIRFPSSTAGDIDSIARLDVPSANGDMTTLESVSDITHRSGPDKILRLGRERQVSVEADVAKGFTVGDANREVGTLPIMKNLPPGVHQAAEGTSKQIALLFGGFLTMLISGLLLTFTVLLLLFRSFFKPIVIMTVLPMSVLGAFAGLWVAGFALDMPALIGLLMLIGLCAKNSILLVELAIEAEQDGQSLHEAIIRACSERARPILMTTAAMIAGMIPTAMALGDGASSRQPLAIAVIGGMMTSTILSLLFVPAFYIVVSRMERRILPYLASFVTPRYDPTSGTEGKLPKN